jgi:hypothetical protein
MCKAAWSTALVAIMAVVLVLPAPAVAHHKGGSIKQVGHEPLLNRGMNAALAIHGRYAYIGSRTDGSNNTSGTPA